MGKVLTYEWNEAINAAMQFIPAPYREMCVAYWVIGVSPIRAGVHAYRDTDDGRSFENTAHVAYPHHLSRKRPDSLPVVIVPERPISTLRDVATVVHELGHVAHWALGFGPELGPVSDYAKTNRWEAFAEAWSVMCLGADCLTDIWRNSYRSLDRDEVERMDCLLVA